MAENKKSFLLYTDIYHTIKILSDEQAGKLFKHILGYVNDENPETDDLVTNISFEPIKQSLKRDLIKYEGYVEKQRINGAKGGRPKKTQKTQAFISKPKKGDSVSVSDSVNVIKKDIPTYLDFKLYAFKNSTDIDSEKLNLKYKSWKENGWKDGYNKPIKNWKSKLLNTLSYLKNSHAYTDKL